MIFLSKIILEFIPTAWVAEFAQGFGFNLANIFSRLSCYNVIYMAKKKVAKVLQYTAVFTPDKEVGGYTVTIPSLPGCISEGDTFEQALNNIKEAASLYLDVMKEQNEDIPEEDSGTIIAPVQVTV